MCKHGTLTKVTITPKPFEVKLDSCIADEIVRLNNEGVRTVGCCCGHGDGKPNALIETNHGSLQKAIELGYEPKEYDQWIYQIELKIN